jgi:hypothetical protein
MKPNTKRTTKKQKPKIRFQAWSFVHKEQAKNPNTGSSAIHGSGKPIRSCVRRSQPVR